MKIVRQILLIIIGVLIVEGSLSARTVEIWPGINKIGRWKISKNIPYYSNLLNFVIKDGKLYPIPTKLTFNYIKYRPYYMSIALLDTKAFMNNINSISNIQKGMQNIYDPISILKMFFPMKTNAYIDDAVNNFFMGIAGVIVEKMKGVNTKAALTKAVIEYIFKDEFLKSLSVNLSTSFINNEAIKTLISHSVGVVIDYLWEKVLSEGQEAVAKELYSGFMGELAFYSEVLNGVVNISSTIWAINSINNKTIKKEVDIYVNQFLHDYIIKYNTNIIAMAHDSVLDKSNAKSYIFSNKKYYPLNFFQIFIMYGIKNHYLNDFDLLNNNNNIYYLWLAAHKALNLIEKFGDGGNLRIFLDVNKNNEKISVKVDPKSYYLYSYYWMLPLSESNNIAITFDAIYNLNLSTIESIFQRLIYVSYIDYSNVNPFYNSLILKSTTNVNISGISNKQMVQIQNKFANIALELNLSKVINYNGFLKKDYQIYNKKRLKINNIFIVPYNKNINNILFKYINLGIVDYNVNIGEQLFLPITQSKLKSIFIRYANLSSVFSKQEVINSFRNISWTSPIKRKQFFKFLVKLLKIDTTPQYSANFSNVYSDIFTKNNGTCYDTTLEGCALRTKGILTGNNPDGTLTLFQVLLTLDKIESTYKK